MGGTTHLSIFWWQDSTLGYGVSHLYAPGGLVPTWSGVTNESVIAQVDGYYPEADRSFLCRQVTFTRSTERSDEVSIGRVSYRPTIGYVPEPRGLAFCQTDLTNIQAYPDSTFYPEATVLAYLLHSEDERANINDMENWVANRVESPNGQVRENVVQAIADFVGPFKRVNSLTYYSVLDMADSAQARPREALEMQVVAELVVGLEEGETPSLNPTLAGRNERLRTILFTLQHQPVVLNPDDPEDRRWDRWLIVNAIAGGQPRP